MALQELRNLEAGLTLDDDDKPVAADRIQVKQSGTTQKEKKTKQKKKKAKRRDNKFENLLKQMAEKRKQDREDGRLTRRERKRFNYDTGPPIKIGYYVKKIYAYI